MTLLSAVASWFRPAPHVPRRPPDEVERLYPRYRARILEATFLGYATFYLVRNNLATVAKDLEGALAYDHTMIGSILAATSISYGVGKFLMGALSDRSDPRKFMATGLALTALLNFAFGSVRSFPLHLFLWALNGLVQGMGWPPCGRSIGHWFGVAERGTVFAVWNVAHNVGGGLAGVIAARAAAEAGWPAAFYFPGAIALVGSVYLFLRLRDTPQSVGLPPIEVYRREVVAETAPAGAAAADDGSVNPHDGTVHDGRAGAPDGSTDARGRAVAPTAEAADAAVAERERELGTRELLVEHILKNRALWLVACANFFVYITRYSMLDWGPTYLREVKGASLEGGGIAVLAIEFGGIPSTILLGWLSDRMGGRRGMVSLLCMIPVFLAFAGIRLNPAGHLWVDMALLMVVGFFVYPPVMLLGVAALDLTSKKAVGTAAGFVGLFGYLGRTVQAQGFGWMRTQLGEAYGAAAGWNAVLGAILACTVAAIVLLAFTWRIRPRDVRG